MNPLNLFRHPAGLRDLTAAEVLAARDAGRAVVIDVRTPSEYRSGHIEGALSIPMGREAQILRQWAPDTPLILICRTGHRSQAVAHVLLKNGYQAVSHLKGGMTAYQREHYPVTVD
jgi:rhodanese-related sulfurtransferase